MLTTMLRAACIAAVGGLLAGPVLADVLDDASKAASQTSVAGRLIYFGLPKQTEVDQTIRRLKPYAGKIRVGVGEAGPIYGFNQSGRSALLAAFSDAGFKVCPGWGRLSEIVGSDNGLRDGHMKLLNAARKQARQNALIVDKKPYTDAGSSFFYDDMVVKGAGTGMDRLFVDIGTKNGAELRNDRAFATMAAMMSEQIKGGAEWDCMNGE